MRNVYAHPKRGEFEFKSYSNNFNLDNIENALQMLICIHIGHDMFQIGERSETEIFPELKFEFT